MRMIALAGLALALSACGGGGSDSAANGANTVAGDDLMMDQNLMMDANVSMNGTTGMDGSMAGNGAVDANAANMMAKDATTNDPDTNLANGL